MSRVQYFRSFFCSGATMESHDAATMLQMIPELFEPNVSQWDNDTMYEEAMAPTLPPELRFNTSALVAIVVYSCLFVVAAVGNVTVFVTLYRNRHRKSRINLMIMHLAIADMVVTFVMIPLEVGWRATTQWLAGNAACKVLLFLRAFGLYLSSMVLVCVSLDRYFAILYPLRVNDARRRGKLMLTAAWLVSIVCSLPQVSFSSFYREVCRKCRISFLQSAEFWDIHVKEIVINI